MPADRRSHGRPWAQIEIELRDDMPRVEVRGALRERMSDAGIGSIALSTAFARHYATATAIALRTAGVT